MLFKCYRLSTVQGVTAQMNLTQFIIAFHKCILASRAMKNCTKWALQTITLLFKVNLASLKEVSSQKKPT